MSIYPNAIDGFEQLPVAIDGITKINAYSVNNLREAILNIERELGIRPSSYYSSVRERLDALEMKDSSPIETRVTQLENAVAAIEADLGLNYKGPYSSLAARLDYIDSLLPDEPLFLEAGEDILKGHLLRITNLGKVRLAYANIGSDDPEDLKYARVVGSVSNKYDDGESARIYASAGTLINVRFDDAEIPISTNNGSLVYLSATPGLGTLTPPDSPGSVIFSLGILQGANGSNVAPKVVFQPNFIAYISL
jgi:hypothetical protein